MALDDRIVYLIKLRETVALRGEDFFPVTGYFHYKRRTRNALPPSTLCDPVEREMGIRQEGNDALLAVCNLIITVAPPLCLLVYELQKYK